MLTTAIRKEEEISHPNWKGRSEKLFADGVILYIENPKDPTKRILELINKLSKVAGYKVNIQKSMTFSYTNNELPETLRKQPHL